MTGFKVQILTSPGIRKDQHDDQELGEDAIGCLVKDDYVVLWVADGAPGTKIDFKGLNFGSRVLAKYMGECFETVALKSYTPKTPFDDAFLEEFATELRKQLSTRLAGVHTQLAQVKDKVDLDDALEIKMNGTQKTYALTWAATFVGALVDMKNNVCYTMSIGDCVALSDGTVTLRYEPPPPEPEPVVVPPPTVQDIDNQVHVLDLTKKPVVLEPVVPVDPNAIVVTGSPTGDIDKVEATKWLFPPIRPKAVGEIKHTTKERVLKLTVSMLKSVNDASINAGIEIVKFKKQVDTNMFKYYYIATKKLAIYGSAAMKKVDNLMVWMADGSVILINGTIKFISDAIFAVNRFMNKAVDKAIDTIVCIVYYKKIKAQKEAARQAEEAKKLKEEAAKKLKDAEEAEKAKQAAEAAALNPPASTMIEEVFGEPKLKIITGRANRMFVLWSTNEALDSFEITDTVNSPCFGEIEDVKSIILMSDGVIPYNEIECQFGYKDPDSVWDELKSTNHTTDDDKTAIYFKILGQH